MLHRQQMSLLAIAFFLIAPASAMAQQAGPVIVENATGATIRIGCDYYIDSNGNQVDLDASWDVPPGYKGKLLFRALGGNLDIVARKFVYYLITPDGESAGWTMDKLTAGNLHYRLGAETLAQHKNIAGNQVSKYPPLTAKAVGIAQLKTAIANDEQRLQQLNIAVPALQLTAVAAKALNDNYQSDPNRTNGEKFSASAAVIAADFAVNTAIATRDTVQSNLRTNRQRLSDLQAQPD